MTCVECKKNRADQMKKLFYENKENCREAYQDGYNEALEDAIHNLDNTKVNCHEDYIDGIDFAIGVLRNMIEKSTK